MSKLRETREKRGLTLEELAAKSGVSRQRIAELEKDETEIMVAKTGTLKSIADALEETMSFLFFDDTVNHD